MATIGSRKVKDLIDNQTQEPIYIKGHAQATFMSDGATVEDAINNLLVSGIGEGGTTGESIPSSVTAQPNTIVKRDGAGQVYANAVIDENNMIWVTPTSSIDTIESADRVIQERITDIDEIREGAAKGATALQSYTEQYKGTVTSVKVNGVTKNQSSGVVDLGYINKQLSTSTSSSMTLSPNIYYRNTSTSLSTLTITLGGTTNNDIINEYFVEFTTRDAGTTVSLPNSIKWANGVAPTFENGKTYQISIVNNLGTCVKFG